MKKTKYNIPPFYQKKINALANYMGRYGTNRGVDIEDLISEGTVVFLSFAKRYLDEVPSERAWNFFEPNIKRAMAQLVRNSMWGCGRFISLESISECLDGDDADILDILNIETSMAEQLFAPNDAASRYAIVFECERQLSELGENNYIYKREDGLFDAKLRIAGKTVKIAECKSISEARGARARALRIIRDSCLPINVGKSNKKPSNLGSRIKYKKGCTSLWQNIARDNNPGTSALPSFFYWNPLDALIIIEDLADIRNNAKSHYEFETPDTQKESCKKWRADKRNLENDGRI